MGKVIYINKTRGGNIMPEKKNNFITLARLILYFANNTTEKLYKTKLNKLLFYTQFLYYKLYSRRLLLNDFIRDYHGPTIRNLDEYLRFFSDAEIIKLGNSGYGTVILPNTVMSSNSYSENERGVLKKVLNKFDKYSASAISEYSHNETLWLHTAPKQIIDINRADELNDL